VRRNVDRLAKLAEVVGRFDGVDDSVGQRRHGAQTDEPTVLADPHLEFPPWRQAEVFGFFALLVEPADEVFGKPVKNALRFRSNDDVARRLAADVIPTTVVDVSRA
jgi:hypothetical protein